MKVQTRKLRTQLQQRRDSAQAVKSSPHGLLAPLNRKSLSKRAQQLVELVRTLQEIEVIEANLADPKYHGNVYPEDAPHDLYLRANEILSACHWSPRVDRPPNESYSFSWSRRTRKSDWENQFVSWILNVRARGDFSLIRNCKNCELWFHAVTNHQTFCGGGCRQQFHSKNALFKDKRRLYMRLYRKKEKARNLSAIRAAQQRSGWPKSRSTPGRVHEEQKKI